MKPVPMTFRDMTKDELVALLEQRTVLADEAARQDRERLIHELEVHQTELETQNTQLREAQEELEESRALYADLYDFAPVAYVTLDEAGCIVHINLAGAKLLQRERAVLIGTPVATFLDNGDRKPFREHLAGCFRSESTALQIDLHDHALQVVSVPYRDARTGSRRCRTVLIDVTEERRAELAVRLALRMREDFLAIVSHELRNPLNAITMAIELLLHAVSGVDRRERSRPQLEVMQRGAARMDRLLADLLDLSSMDAGQLAMRMGEHAIAEIIEASLEAVMPAAGAKGVELVYDVPCYGIVHCDHDRVVQVLVNLATNAVKFTPAGGRVAIRVEPSDDELVFSVVDSGIGITDFQQTQIFAPYWQVDRRSKRGTGLGLSIARGIVESHGGHIGVRSRVGHGSTFYFALSTRPPQTVEVPNRFERPSTVKRTLASAHEHAGSLLVVDDEADAREALAELLRHEGFEVLTARDGKEALEMLAREPERFSIVLLDLVMPGVDGWQFLDRRALDPQMSRIPVVLISGQANAAETAVSLGLDGWVEKPLSLERVRRAVAGVVAKRQARGG